jgi:hypothetical protein
MSRHVELDTPIRPAEVAVARLGITPTRFDSLVEMVRHDKGISGHSRRRSISKKSAKKAAKKR